MSPLLLIGSIVITGTGALAFGYLYHVYQERYLGLWALAWALWPLRYLYGTATIS